MAEPVPDENPTPQQSPAVADSLTPADRVAPTWTDPTVRRASYLIGGPLGRHAQVGRLPVLTPLRACLLLAVAILVLGWLAKSPCIQQTPGPEGTLVLDSSANRQWISGCYNDVTPAFQIYGLDSAGNPYATSTADTGESRPALPYPVLIAAFMWVTGRLSTAYADLARATGLLPDPLPEATYLTVGAIGLGLLYLWAVASTVKLARRRPWDAALMCLSPLLAVHAFTNWDIMPVALLAAALLAWSRQSCVLAGVLLGLGTAAKVYPLLLLVPLAVLAVRTGRVRPVVVTAASAAATWAAVNMPFAIAHPEGWARFFAVNYQRQAEFTTVWAIFSDWSGSAVLTPQLAEGGAPTVLNVVSGLSVTVAMIAVCWLGLSARRRPRLAQLLFLTVAAFLLLTKTWNPQFSLWLLPIAVLAIPRWKPLLAWQFSEAALWFLLMLTFATRGDDAARYALLAPYPYQFTALVRDALLLWLVVLVVRDVLRPAADPVRLLGTDDPAGGVFEGADDRFVLQPLRLPLAPRRRSTAGSDALEHPSG